MKIQIEQRSVYHKIAVVEIEVDADEYDFKNMIEDDPDFAWWAHHIIKKKKHVVAATNMRHLKRTHEGGGRVPKQTKEALEEEKRNVFKNTDS